MILRERGMRAPCLRSEDRTLREDRIEHFRWKEGDVELTPPPTDAADIRAFERLSGNRVIETAALAWVMDLERQAGREPVDRRTDRGFPGDLWSAPRTIELKAVGGDARGADLPLEESQINAAAGDHQFFLYLVDNVAQGNPAQFRLRVFGGDQLQRLIRSVRRKVYYELPVPVREFDQAPSEASFEPERSGWTNDGSR